MTEDAGVMTDRASSAILEHALIGGTQADRQGVHIGREIISRHG